MAASSLDDQATTNKYQEMAILSASKEELTLKIYDFLILSANQAHDRFYRNATDLEGIHLYLLRAQRAISLLMGSLNFEIGGELSKNLFKVYGHWHHELVLANMQRDPSRIANLLPTFREYRDTWAQAIAQFKAEQRAGEASMQGREGFVAVG